MPKPTLEMTAHHEAGHAVAQIVAGLIPDEISIRKGCDSIGHVASPPPLLYGHSTRRELKSTVRSHIVALYAGFEAERKFSLDADKRLSEEDDAMAFNLSREYEVMPRRQCAVGDEIHEAYLDRLRTEARSLVRTNWRWVGVLAQALQDAEVLSGAEAVEILNASGFSG